MINETGDLPYGQYRRPEATHLRFNLFDLPPAVNLIVEGLTMQFSARVKLECRTT